MGVINKVMKKVSVIIPIYNAEKYLKKCLDSIVNQTLKEIEIICVNDGSTDKSLEIIKEYSKKDNRIVVVDKENTGYGNSMNIGINISKGEYVGIVESDDFIELNMFEDLYNIAKKENIYVVKSRYYEITEDTKIIADNIEKDTPLSKKIKSAEYKNNVLGYSNIWTGIYKKEFLDKNNIRFLETKGASYQDTSFAYKTWVYSQEVYISKNAYYNYRLDNENSSVKSQEKVYCICKEYEEILKVLNSKSYFKEWEEITYLKKYLGYRWNYKRIDEKYKEDFLKLMKKEFKESSLSEKINKKIWGKTYYNELRVLLKDRKKYPYMLENDYSYFNKYAINIEDNKIKDIYNDYDKIILYGAGKRGKEIARKLNTDNISFAVTKNETNINSVEGIEVLEIEDFINYKKSALIIMTPILFYQLEMIDILLEYGFENIISINDKEYKKF